MLIILAISPPQLLSLDIVDAQSYIGVSYLCLAGTFLGGLLSFLTNRRCHTVSSFQSQKINVLLSRPKLFLTPLYHIKQQGKFTLFIKVISVLLFWLAVVSNALGQRIEAARAMPSQPIYVDALVTLTELSDKRLTFQPNQQGSASRKNRVVIQGYRQLVTLTDIQPYTERQLLKKDGSNQTTDNPFSNKASSSNISSDSLSNDTNPKQLDTRLPKPMTVMLYSYRADDDWLNTLAPNKQVRMRLKLRPLKTQASENGFNEYRWLSTRHATAIADIIEAHPQDVIINPDLNVWQRINTYRYQLRQHFLESDFYTQNAHFNMGSTSANNNQDAAGVTLSLLTGDRSLISTQMTDLYRFAGISHLLAISGAHVLFLAILVATLSSLLIDTFFPQLYRIVPRWQLRFIVAVGIAFIYAMFAGFDVPAVRTAWMLVIVGVVRYLLAAPSIFKILLILAIALAWQDVFVLWQAGYWLSFVAVTVLIIYSQRFGRQANTHLNTASVDSLDNSTQKMMLIKIKQMTIDFLKLQLWMSLALLPISLWLFGKVSLWGFVVNLFAIGLYGWVIVPLDLLAGLSDIVSTTVADGIWSFITWLLSIFHSLLGILQTSANQVGWIHTDISLPVLLLLMLMVLPFVLPKGIMSRYLCLPALLAVAMVSVAGTTSQEQTRITVIDTANPNIFAVLVSSEDTDWLLLSAYGNQYKPNDSIINTEQKRQLRQHIYDQLQQNNVDVLTGIIVQTANPEMASIAADLHQIMPISYYWQAGLKAHSAKIESDMTGVGLTPQSCVPDRYWSQASLNNKETPADGLLLQAVTGWQDIDDASVHDCTMRIRSGHPVILTDNNGGVSLKPTETLSSGNSNVSTEVIIYSSRHLKLSKLWALMCVDNLLMTQNTSMAQVSDSMINPTAHHLLVSPQSTIDKTLLDAMYPQSFQIIGNYHDKVTKDLQETQLEWQQQRIK